MKFKTNKIILILLTISLLAFASCKKSGSGDQFNDSETKNNPPTASVQNAGVCYVGDAITLDGTRSSDKEQKKLKYIWSILSAPSGSKVSFTPSDSAEAKFVPDVEGEFVISLTVNDGKLNSKPVEVKLSVNKKPEAEAGKDTTCLLGEKVNLDGSLSTGKGALTYSWKITYLPVGSKNASIQEADTASPEFTPDITGSYTISLVVNDGETDSKADEVTVTVLNNQKPVANAGSDIYERINNPVSLDGSSSIDPENRALTYLWTIESKPSGSTASIANETSQFSEFTPDKIGMYKIKLVVNDGVNSSSPDYVFISTGFKNSIGMEFIPVKPGTFTMGSPEDEPYREQYEEQHDVTLSKGYFIMTTEVTQAMWFKLLNSSNYDPSKDPFANMPIGGMYLPSLTKFMDKLNSLNEGRYRFPTEAEWEYAARAGTDTAFFNGPITDRTDCSTLNESGWYYGNSLIQPENMPSSREPHEVAKKKANPWGLYDMHGNVQELCSDQWDGKSSYGSAPVLDPVGTNGAAIVRGGSYNYTAEKCRSAYRSITLPNQYHNFPAYVGLRFVREFDSDPIANAGYDKTSHFGENIVLDGSESRDPDGKDLKFSWEILESPSGSTNNYIMGQNSETAYFNPDKKGTYRFKLTVTNSLGKTDVDDVTVAVNEVKKLVLFLANGAVDGDLGGREGADKIVRESASRIPGDVEYHAFISVSSEDSIKNMPENFNFPSDIPVYAFNPVKLTDTGMLAKNWDDLLDGNIPTTLNRATSLSGLTSYWWSGSSNDGTATENTCGGWENNDGSKKGSTGHMSFASDWINRDGPKSSDEKHALIGLAIVYGPASPITEVQLFSTQAKVLADFGGRNGADKIVREDPFRPNMPFTYAFLSVNKYDAIKNMARFYNLPDNLPVKGPNGNIIADNFADLLDGSFNIKLDEAGLFPEPEANPYWWSGSESDGSISSRNYHANNWTELKQDGSLRGDFGSVYRIDGGNAPADSKPSSFGSGYLHAYHLLGIAFK